MSGGRHGTGDGVESSVGIGDDTQARTWLRKAPAIQHSEVADHIEQGGCLRGVVLEAQDDGPTPSYAAYLLSSWRRGYSVLHLESSTRPRLFRSLDRLLALVRVEYAFRGTIALCLASEPPPRPNIWRITHGRTFSRPT